MTDRSFNSSLITFSKNATNVFPQKNSFSSPHKSFFIVKYNDNLDTSTATNKKDEKALSNSLSAMASDKRLIPIAIDVEKKFTIDNARKEEELIENLVNGFVHDLEIALNSFVNEAEEISSAEKKIIEIVNSYSFGILGNVVQRVYISNFDKPDFLVGICKSLSRYDLEEVMPWGPVMLPGLLNHRSEVVKEYAVSLIESWNSHDLLPMLKALEVSSAWLKDYVKDVINYLEADPKCIM